MNKKFITVSQLAEILGISRVAVFKKIKNGQIAATKFGRTYAIPAEYIASLSGKTLSAEDRQRIDRAVVKTVKEYGETLKLLGRE